MSTPSLRVKEIAESKGITFTELEQATNLADDTLRRYWYSRVARLDWDNMQKIATALGVKPKDLISDE